MYWAVLGCFGLYWVVVGCTGLHWTVLTNNKYEEFTFKNDTFNKSFFPFVTKLYNNLDLDMRNLPNSKDFKEQLKAKYKQRKVKHYSRGISKYANTLHTQLRVGQSYLNSHGFKINLREDDLCLCHRSETVSHFFLDCFLYQEERDELFKKISQYLPGFQTFSKTKKLEIILYGFNLSNIEPDPRNISIVFAVQKYIMKPNVFTLHPPPPLPPLQHNHLTPTHTPHLTLSHLLLCWLSLPTFFFLAAPGVELFPQA